MRVVHDFEVPVIVGSKKGKALCDQVRVYNESRLIKKERGLGILSESEMKQIGERILSLLDFEELIDFYWEVYG